MIDDKTNEIPTIPDILDRVVIKDCIVTWDALNTQTINVEKVIDKKLDYVVPIKANHPTFYQELKEYFDEKLCGIPHNFTYVELSVMWNFIKRSPKIKTSQ